MGNDSLAILHQIEQLYHAKAVGENTLGNSANLIFEVTKNETPYIARVSKYSDQKKAHIDFELRWMAYLSGEIDSIVKPILSIHHNLYEVIQVNNQPYIVCVFDKAKGKLVDCHNATECNESLFFTLGALMGDMHRMTVGYDGNQIQPEFEWYNSAFFWDEYNLTLPMPKGRGF